MRRENRRIVHKVTNVPSIVEVLHSEDVRFVVGNFDSKLGEKCIEVHIGDGTSSIHFAHAKERQGGVSVTSRRQVTALDVFMHNIGVYAHYNMAWSASRARYDRTH